MDRLAELLAALPDFSGLSDVDLANLRSELEHNARLAREGELSSEVVQLIKDATEQAVAIKAELAERAAEGERIVREADEALALLDDVEGGDGDETGESAEAPEGDAPPVEVPAGDAPAQAESAPAADAPATPTGEASAPPAMPIAASQSETPKRKAVKVPARHQPRVTARGPGLIAAAGVRNIGVGQQFPDLESVHRAMLDKWVSLRASGDGRPNTIATIDYRDMYPEEQRLANGDPNEVVEKVYRFLDQRNEALVAAGGLGGSIPEPRYQQITYGQASRPVRDGLPTFLASRGQIIYNQSPTLADIVPDTALGAIGTVTAAQDLAGATKNVQEISTPTTVTVVVEAETMRFQQGNFADKFYPERMAAFQRLGMVAFARHNEALRLADIKAGSTLYTDTPAKFGAYRDLKAAFMGALAELRDRIRDQEQQFRCLMPAYVPAMLAVDMVRQAPGDETWDQSLAQMRQAVEAWDPNTTITWTLDSIRGRQLTTPSGASPRTAGFDADVEWALFPEGTWLFLDGGQLDLGIVRDSTLNATNKFQTFFESWEAVAKLAPLSQWVTSSLCADGVSQAAQNVAVCSPQGS